MYCEKVDFGQRIIDTKYLYLPFSVKICLGELDGSLLSNSLLSGEHSQGRNGLDFSSPLSCILLRGAAFRYSSSL